MSMFGGICLDYQIAISHECYICLMQTKIHITPKKEDLLVPFKIWNRFIYFYIWIGSQFITSGLLLNGCKEKHHSHHTNWYHQEDKKQKEANKQNKREIKKRNYPGTIG